MAGEQEERGGETEEGGRETDAGGSETAGAEGKTAGGEWTALPTVVEEERRATVRSVGFPLN